MDKWAEKSLEQIALESGDLEAAKEIRRLERSGLFGAARRLLPRIELRTPQPDDLLKATGKTLRMGANMVRRVPLPVTATAAVIGPSIAAKHFIDRRIDTGREGELHHLNDRGVARLEQAYRHGRTPMTDRFQSFTASKHASAAARAASGSALDALGPLIKKLLYKTKDPEVVTEAVQNTARVRAEQIASNIGEVDEYYDEAARLLGAKRHGMQFTAPDQSDVTQAVHVRAKKLRAEKAIRTEMQQQSALEDSIARSMGAVRDPRDPSQFIIPGEESLALGRAGGLAALGVGAGVSLDALSGDPFSPLGTEIERRLFPIESRVEGREEFAKGFFSSAGKELGSELVENTIGGVSAAIGAAAMMPRREAHRARALSLIDEDPLLSQASTQEKDMLMRAYDSMQRYAPSLAGDEFATKNYLRESLMAANGPDYGTIGNLAKTERMITGDKKR